MSGITVETHQDLVSRLTGALFIIQDCAALDQRLTHSAHQSDYYRDLISRVENLLAAERAVLKRQQTIGR
jgi:hypothetical protein